MADYQWQQSSKFLNNIGDADISAFKNTDPDTVTEFLFKDPNQLPDFFFLPPGIKSAIK